MDLNTTETALLLALLALWAVLLFGGFALGAADEDNMRRMPRWTRLASSLTLVVAAWSWFIMARGSDFETLSLFIATGMTLGFIGDLFMAGLMPVREPVLGGMTAFGLGHIAYIAGMLSYANAHHLTNRSTQWGALAVWLVVGVIGWYIVVYARARNRSILHVMALPYALLLASTAGVATGLALQDDTFMLMAIGAALFLLSDLILAAQLFNGLRFPFISDVVWLMYGPGQMLIVYAAAVALIG